VNDDGVVRQQRGHRVVHSFLPYQASSDPSSCSPPSCLYGIELIGGDNSVLTFMLAASNSTGYLHMMMTFTPPPATTDPSLPPPTPSNWTGTDWLYLTPVVCTTGWIVNGVCSACPSGAYCPGGGRVWPIPGYWSYSEVSPPVPCSLPIACPGALASASVSDEGSRSTSVCAEGYVGTFCTALCRPKPLLSLRLVHPMYAHRTTVPGTGICCWLVSDMRREWVDVPRRSPTPNSTVQVQWTMLSTMGSMYTWYDVVRTQTHR
jgi:hypothetical protein